MCNGTCERDKRHLACWIFPFFPTIDENGRIFVEADFRGARLCPLISHSDEIVFDPKFFKALKKVGKIQAKDKEHRVTLWVNPTTLKMLDSLEIKLDNRQILDYIISNKKDSFEQIYNKGYVVARYEYNSLDF